jgi:hypothetical protein
MLNLRHVDFVIGFVGANPFDPKDGFFEIDRHEAAIIIALYVEDDPLISLNSEGSTNGP